MTASLDRADVVIVGAGMAGLTAARTVAEAGHSVIVVDKGRAVGGRMATRRIGEAKYDHGAQHFSARSGEFRSAVRSWASAGIAVEWFRSPSVSHPERGVEPRHAGAGGMRTIPEHLAAGLDVRTQVRVERIEPRPGGVIVSWPGGDLNAGAAVVTAPVPQVIAMVAGDEGLDALARSISYDPCLAVMAELDRSSRLGDGHVAPSDGPVAWIGDNQHKGISAVPAVTIHSTPGFARAHFVEEPEEWVGVLTEAASSLLEAEIVAATGHRWRYSQPQSTLDTGFHPVTGGPIVVAGEAFGGARIEGAFLSGRAAGRAVLEYLEG